MATITKGLLAAGLTLMGLVLGPALIPMGDLRKAIEAQLTNEFGRPIKVGRIYFVVLPRPQLVLEGVADDRQTLQVGRARVVPAVGSLFTQRIVLRQLKLSDIHADAEALQSLFVRRQAPAPSNLLVQRIRIDNATLRAGPASFDDIQADILIGADGRPQRIDATLDGERLRVQVLPTATGALQVAMQGSDWSPPLGSRIRLDQVEATALLEPNRIEAWNVQARIGKGSAFGFLSVRWTPAWTVTGEFSLRDVAIAKLLATEGAPPAVEGLLQATPRFVMRARQVDKLLHRLELASDFVVHDAIVRKFDLEAAVGSGSSARKVDSVSQFDRISGHVAYRRGRFQFSELKGNSGALVATGSIAIGADRSLHGRVDAQLRNTSTLLAIPLRVSGSLDDPRIVPTTGALAGAALGSVLLPGAGTAIGAKAGQLAEDFIDALP